MKFSANNFITPRNDAYLDPIKSTGRKMPVSSISSVAAAHIDQVGTDDDGGITGTGHTKQSQDMLSLKIVEQQQQASRLDASNKRRQRHWQYSNSLYRGDDDCTTGEQASTTTMQHYVEDNLNGGGIGSRRSSIRVNSLLFEEDSRRLREEMERQKQAK